MPWPYPFHSLCFSPCVPLIHRDRIAPPKSTILSLINLFLSIPAVLDLFLSYPSGPISHSRLFRLPLPPQSPPHTLVSSYLTTLDFDFFGALVTIRSTLNTDLHTYLPADFPCFSPSPIPPHTLRRLFCPCSSGYLATSPLFNPSPLGLSFPAPHPLVPHDLQIIPLLVFPPPPRRPLLDPFIHWLVTSSDQSVLLARSGKALCYPLTLTLASRSIISFTLLFPFHTLHLPVALVVFLTLWLLFIIHLFVRFWSAIIACST